MNVQKRWLERIGLIAALVNRSPGQVLGRTAVMKLIYLLQVLKQAPLGYDFQLYTYGPFDPDVLNDLLYAQVFGAVTERNVVQRSGYRYEIRPGKHCLETQHAVAGWLKQFENDLNWVVEQFGYYNSQDLELFSTIVYVDRENAKEQKRVSRKELASQVQSIKPRFTQTEVLVRCRQASEKGFLVSAVD
jgi:uncharacterized protein